MKRLKHIHSGILKGKLRKEAGENDPAVLIDNNYQEQLEIQSARFTPWFNQFEALDQEKVSNYVSDQIDALCECLAGDDEDRFQLYKRVCGDAFAADVVLTCLIDIFERADQRHMKALDATLAPNTWVGYYKSGTSYMALFKDVNGIELHHSFTALPLLLACIKQMPGTKALWPELKVWMQGVHAYHANLLILKLKKADTPYHINPQDTSIQLEEGMDYPPINSTDKIMLKVTNLTFYHLALHILRASESLDRVLSGNVLSIAENKQPAVCLFSTQTTRSEDQVELKQAYSPGS